MTDGFYIDLGGARTELRCSLGAAKQINAYFGNFNAANRRLIDYDFTAYVFVIAYGTDRPARDVESAVYATGLLKLVTPLCEYVAALANGGRPPETTEGGTAKPGEGV